MNEMHEANRAVWNAWSPQWKARKDATQNWRHAFDKPWNPLDRSGIEHIERYLGSMAGRKAIVLGSGDNAATFALAGLGAAVTSVDISERQLEVAAERAQVLGVDITLHRGDISDLPELPGSEYHFACSVGLVAPWISDLRSYYAEASRLLVPGGLFLISEPHPVRHSFEHGRDYFDRGPFPMPYDPETLEELPHVDAADASHVYYGFHHTCAEYLTALIDAGLEILHVEEDAVPDDPQWLEAKQAGFPFSWQIISRKKGDLPADL